MTWVSDLQISGKCKIVKRFVARALCSSSDSDVVWEGPGMHLHNNNAHKPVLVLGHAAPGDVHRETLQLFHDLALDVGVRSARHLNHDLVRQVHVHLDVVDAAGLLLRIGVDLLTFRAGSDECGIHGHFPQIWTGQVMTCRSVVLLRRVNG